MEAQILLLSLSLSCLSDSYKMHSLKKCKQQSCTTENLFSIFYEKNYWLFSSIFNRMFNSVFLLPFHVSIFINFLCAKNEGTAGRLNRIVWVRNLEFIVRQFDSIASFLLISTCIGLRSLESSLNIAVVIAVIVKSDVKGINIMPCAYQKEIL